MHHRAGVDLFGNRAANFEDSQLEGLDVFAVPNKVKLSPNIRAIYGTTVLLKVNAPVRNIRRDEINTQSADVV